MGVRAPRHGEQPAPRVPRGRHRGAPARPRPLRALPEGRRRRPHAPARLARQRRGARAQGRLARARHRVAVGKPQQQLGGAVLGAVLLDGGFPAAEAVFARLFADDVAALSEVPAGGESPKSALQVLAARAFRDQPAYRILSQDGPPDAPSFVAEASVAGRAATGAGRTKQAAQTAAAAALLAILREEPSGPRAGRPPCGRTGACGRIDPVSPKRTSAAQP